jgi:hypothetical protein
VLSLGGGDEELRRIQTDGSLRRKLAELIVAVPKFLKQVATAQVTGTQKFVAAEMFGPNNPDGIQFYLGDNFKKHFLKKIEENVQPANITIHLLEKNSRDPEIMVELGQEKRNIFLAHFYQMIRTQPTGQEGKLLVSGRANIGYISDNEGNVWAVYAFWNSDYREWYVNADSVERQGGWSAGLQVLSQE